MTDPSNAFEKPATSQPQNSERLQEQPFKRLSAHFLVRWISSAALILLICSSFRHFLFRSTAFDLGIYDQVVYLLSQGLPPISSYLGFHHMGNHAAWAVYPLALFYKIYPSVYWLLAVQAVCLAIGAWPTWLLAVQAGLSPALARAMVVVYLLYPLIFNLNLFDFHPEVMALPVLLTAIWLARAGRPGWFCLAILFVLGCKDALSLTVVAMGVWLLLFEKRRFCGIAAIALGSAWFLIATQWIIPMLSGGEAAAVDRYGYLGKSVFEVAKNLLLQPGLALGKIISKSTVFYLLLIISPLLWGLSPRFLAPLISAIPAFMLNVLSEAHTQRDLMHQYSLPILPFLLVVVIDSLAAGKGWLRQRRWIVLWSLVAFIALAKYYFLGWQYLQSLDTWQASRTAIAQIQTQGGVLTDNYLGPHVSHRPIVYMPRIKQLNEYLKNCDYVLLNLRHPWQGQEKRIAQVMQRLKQQPEFKLSYQQDDVYLFTRSKS
jgi:uncharacterized membrane protein